VSLACCPAKELQQRTAAQSTAGAHRSRLHWFIGKSLHEGKISRIPSGFSACSRSGRGVPGRFEFVVVRAGTVENLGSNQCFEEYGLYRLRKKPLSCNKGTASTGPQMLEKRGGLQPLRECALY
jgi:hypothetical protein